MTCKYCGYTHNVMGDVVCPILNRFPNHNTPEPWFAMQATWKVKKHSFSEYNFGDLKPSQDMSFQGYINYQQRTWAMFKARNPTY